MMQPIGFKSAPNVLIFEINSGNIKHSKTLKFEQEGETVVLGVKGLIYHGDFHFTSCIIGTDGIVWYHDGMATGSSCENEGDFDKFFSRNLLKCKGKKIDLSSVCKSLIRGRKWKWVGGIILHLVPSAIQLGWVNSPVFRVENHIGKLVF
jgi:hypothetical protein